MPEGHIRRAYKSRGLKGRVKHTVHPGKLGIVSYVLLLLLIYGSMNLRMVINQTIQ